MRKEFSNAPIGVFNNPNYINYVVQYQGDIAKDAELSSKYYITVINDEYAVITMPFDKIINDRYFLSDNLFPSVVYISRYYIYSLEEEVDKESISPIIASNIINFHDIEPLNLTGKGTVVGIIDTGIDYLNKEFLNKDGTTRILSIWDQTINVDSKTKSVPFGEEYSAQEINNAIKAFNEGKSPYDIVPSKDEIGHGTSMAGVIGARGENKEIIGAAPECDFVVVKLSRALSIEKSIITKGPIYDKACIMLALKYLFDYAVEKNVPMIIYLPLGTTLGNQKVNGILEDFIDDICNNIGIAVITGVGNEANAGNHASGVISNVGDFTDVDLYVSEEQSFIRAEVWIDKPNIMSIDIISPSGENSGKIQAFLGGQKVNKFIFEETTVSVEYFLPDEITGDELIFIGFFNLQPGVWKIRIYGDYILDGKYNLWLLPKVALLGGTRFSAPDNYGTITNPSASRYIISVANYNQTNFNLVASSGLAFSDPKYNQIDIAAGGINVKTTGVNNTVVTMNGTCVSAAVVAGASALMFQWAIVEKNDPGIYAQTLKSYLLRGTIKRSNDIYPNPQLGFGILDLVGVFRNLE